MDPGDEILDLLFDKTDGILNDQDPYTSLQNVITDKNCELNFFPSICENVQFDELFKILENDNFNNFLPNEQTNYMHVKNITSDHGYSKAPIVKNDGVMDVTNSVSFDMPLVEDNSAFSMFSSDNSSPNSDTFSDTNFSYDENHSPLSQAVEFLDLDAFQSEMDYNVDVENLDCNDNMINSNFSKITTSSDIWSEDDDHLKKSNEMPVDTILNITSLAISDEEKILLQREGYELPTHLPLTKSEERALKTVRRKIRNKISAKESRQRKCLYVEGLEKRVEACTKQNIDLQRKVETLEKQNMNLKAKFLKLQAFINNGNKPTQPSTCLMVLMLSLALLVAPNLNIFNDDKEVSNENQVVMPGRSRNILQHDNIAQHDLHVNDLNANDIPIDGNPTMESQKSKVVYKSIINPDIFRKAGVVELNADKRKFFDKMEQPPDLNSGDKISMVQSWIETNFDEPVFKQSKLDYSNIANSLGNFSTFNEMEFNNDIVLDHNYTQSLRN